MNASGAEWARQVVTPDFLTEGAAAGDIDGDGAADIVAGCVWYKGPDFKESHKFRDGGPVATTVYQEESFLSWVDDVDGDGRQDILMASRPGKRITLYLNKGGAGNWPAFPVMEEASTECPAWVDVFGDGKKRLVCMQGGAFGYAGPDAADVTKPWKFTAISEKRTDSPYVHGLGAGDLNGDGRQDIAAADGWFEQPAERDGKWAWHALEFANPGGSQMLIFDADGDGDNDVVTSVSAHGYGLAWFEAARPDGNVTFTRHEILPSDPAKSGEGGLQFSQLHALASGDFDKDGRMDFVTGKRFYAHNGHDPGANDPALTVIFHNRKDRTGVRWEPEVIARDCGVGCQVIAVNPDGDGTPEILVGSKKGVSVLSKMAE